MATPQYGYSTGPGTGVITNASGQKVASYNAYANTPAKSSSTPAASSPAPAAQSQSLPLQSQPSAPTPNYDLLIQPAIDAYNSYISTLQGQLPGTLAGIDQTLSNQTTELNNSIGQQTQTVNTSKTQQQQNEMDAANQARSLYNDLATSARGAYGGGSSYGLALESIAGKNLGQNLASIRNTAAGIVNQLDDKLVQIQQTGQTALQDLQTSAAQQKQQAQDKLDSEVADIRSQIGNTEAHKADLYAQAYSNYQQEVANVNAQNAAFQQNLYLQQQDAANKLATAKATASSLANAVTPEQLQSLISANPNVSFSGTVDAGGAPVKASYGGSSNYQSVSVTLPSGQQVIEEIDPATGQVVNTINPSGGSTGGSATSLING